MPTLQERLRSPKRWCCIFEHEGHMRHGDFAAPFEAADALDAADEVLDDVRRLLSFAHVRDVISGNLKASQPDVMIAVENALTLLRKGKESARSTGGDGDE